MASDTHTSDSVVEAIENLRLAEARLVRRRQLSCGPSENARLAARLVYERDDAGEETTPTIIAEHLGVSTAAVTNILEKLRDGNLVTLKPHPRDGRSKLVVPFSRSTDLESMDPLSGAIRSLSSKITPALIDELAEFLRQITDAVDAHCR